MMNQIRLNNLMGKTMRGTLAAAALCVLAMAFAIGCSSSESEPAVMPSQPAACGLRPRRRLPLRRLCLRRLSSRRLRSKRRWRSSRLRRRLRSRKK